MIDFSRTTRNDDDHDEDDYLTPCITRLLVLHLQPFHYTRVSRNGPPPSFTIDFRRQFSHNLLQGRTNLHPHVHNFPLLPFQRFLLPRSTRFVARARSSSIFKDSFIIFEMAKSKSGTNRDRERMNGGYSFASSYLRIERVRSSVFKSGQSPAEFCSSSKFTRGNYTGCNRLSDFVHRTHSKCSVPF